LLDRLGRRGAERRLLDKRIGAMVEAALRHRFGVETVRALPDLAAGIAAALVVVSGCRSGLGPGDIAGALAALGLLLTPLRDPGGVWNHDAAHPVASRKAVAFPSRRGRDVYRSGRSLPKGTVDVVFEGVSLPSGTVLDARFGRGADSTRAPKEGDAPWLCDVLLGLEAASTGRLLLSGNHLRDLSCGTLRRNVQCLGARPTILQRSLRRALVLGHDNRPDGITLEGLATGHLGWSGA
jgi:hypothetical protein